MDSRYKSAPPSSHLQPTHLLSLTWLVRFCFDTELWYCQNDIRFDFAAARVLSRLAFLCHSLTGAEMNLQFDFAMFPHAFELVCENNCYYANHIVGPQDLFNNETLRRYLHDQVDWGVPVPVDVFIMAQGEPDNRAATKVGGLPYRPANLKWPVSTAGQPLGLIAQFNFTDSRDLYSNLPGDLLLIFGIETEYGIEVHYCEWQSLGDFELVKSIPARSLQIPPCYGYRYRTVNFPDARLKDERQRKPAVEGRIVEFSYHLFCYQAIQIGRAPYFIQDFEKDDKLTPLCTISSMWPDQRRPYPWVNKPLPIKIEPSLRDVNSELMIDDVGCFYFFLTPDGQVEFFEQSF